MSAVAVALVQPDAGPELAPNLARLGALIRQARDGGAQLIATPENAALMVSRRETALALARPEAEHPAVAAFADLARETGAWLLLGSVAVTVEAHGEQGDRLANRSILFRPDGSVAARYDKVHLFQYTAPDGTEYREQATYRPGERAVVAETPWGALGMSVCYDLRFAALYRALAQAGARIVTVPSAFTVPTGQAHWHVLLRARAIETGAFVLAPAQTGAHEGNRRTYGHSLVVAPWGEVLADAGEAEGVVHATLDMGRVDEARASLQSLRHDRPFALASDPAGIA